MPTRRLVAVHVLLGALLLGHLTSGVSRRELWPFSPYPMYAWRERSAQLSRLQLVGIAAQDGAEVMLNPVRRYIGPLDAPRLYLGFSRIVTRPGPAAQADGRAALRYYLSRYEERRRAGRHHGPRLAALRMFRLFWRSVDARAPRPATPDGRTLVLQVLATPEGGS